MNECTVKTKLNYNRENFHFIFVGGKLTRKSLPSDGVDRDSAGESGRRARAGRDPCPDSPPDPPRLTLLQERRQDN